MEKDARTTEEEKIWAETTALFSSRILPVDPHEYRLLTDKVCINVGRVAHAINTRQIDCLVEEFSTDRALKTQWPVRSYGYVYPEELSSENNKPFETIWPFFSWTPLIVLKDGTRQRWLLDGGLRARMAAHQGAKSVRVYVIELAEALRIAEPGVDANAVKKFEDLPGEPLSWPAGATLPDKGALAGLLLEKWIDPKDRSLEIVDDFFIVVFAIYFEQIAIRQGATFGENYQEKMREVYDALNYEGVPIQKRFSFDAMYRNRKADALRRVFGIGRKDRLPNAAFSLRGAGAGPETLLRLMYAAGLVAKQIEEFNSLLSRLSPKKRDPLLLDRFMEETRQREEQGAQQLKSAGALPINIVDFLNVAQATGVNAARFYPNRQRMQGVLDWICAWRARVDGHDVVTPLMRAQFAYRTFILMNGSDPYSLDWEILLRYGSPEANGRLIAGCWREMFACDPDLLKASKIDEMLAGS